MNEFYFRDTSDPNYIPDILSVSNEVEGLIYQIKMILGTTKGEVLGEANFGANVEDMLFAYDFNPDMFSGMLVKQVNYYSEAARHFNLGFSVGRIRQARYNDVGVIDVKINGKSLMGFIY